MEHKEAKKQAIGTARRKKKPKNEDSVRNLWDNFKSTNLCITGCQTEKTESKKLKTYLKK